MSSKKSTTNSTQNFNTASTTTPQVPDWLSSPYKAVAGNISGLIDANPLDFASQPSALQNEAFTRAGGMGPASELNAADAAYSGAPQVESASLLDNLSSYYNPFKDQILNPVLSDYDTQAGKTRAAQAAQAGASGAFRGARQGLKEAATEGELARGRASTEGGLLKDMFNTSTSLANSDAQRRQEASSANASNALSRASGLTALGNSRNAQEVADTGLLAGLGQTQQQLDDKQRQAPLNYAGVIEGLLNGLNPQLFTGSSTNASGTQTGNSTTTENGGIGGFLAPILAAAAQGAAGAAVMSDRRLKRDIVKLGTRPDGIGVYAFRYLWSKALQIGVMAQEVLRVKPEAVSVTPSGFFAVDYGKL